MNFDDIAAYFDATHAFEDDVFDVSYPGPLPKHPWDWGGAGFDVPSADDWRNVNNSPKITFDRA